MGMTMRFVGLVCVVMAAALGLSCEALAKPAPIWVPAWYAAPAPSSASDAVITDQTVRQIVHVTAGGKSVRIRLSNAYGTAPLHFDKVRMARRSSGNCVMPGSAPLTFQGAADVTVAPGAYVISDPLVFNVPGNSDLAVSLYAAGPAKLSTMHLTQRNAIYYASGDMTEAASLTPVAAPSTGSAGVWLSEVEVTAAPTHQTIVAFGDSITDGAELPADGNTGWPNVLAARLKAAGEDISVVNAGITGNRLLHNGSWAPFGVAGLARFDADVLAQPNVKAVIVLLGINDIGQVGQGGAMQDYVSPRAIEDGLTQLAVRAHARSIRIYVGTLTPFKETTIKDYYSPDKDVARQAVNAWIRSSTVFDGVVDFDKVLEDPATPGSMRSAYDSGDHLHPGAAGDKAMGEAIPLSWFK